MTLLDEHTCDGEPIEFEPIRVDSVEKIQVLGESTQEAPGPFVLGHWEYEAEYRFSNSRITWNDTTTPKVSGTCRVRGQILDENGEPRISHIGTAGALCGWIYPHGMYMMVRVPDCLDGQTISLELWLR